MVCNCECQVRFGFVAIQSFMCVSYAVVSYDVITPHGIIWYHVVLHCMIWNHMVPYHMVSYHILWDDIIWYDSIWDTSEHLTGHKYKTYLSVILYCDCQEISVEGRDVCEMVQQCTKFAYVPIPINTVIWLRWQGKLREHVLELLLLDFTIPWSTYLGILDTEKIRNLAQKANCSCVCGKSRIKSLHDLLLGSGISCPWRFALATHCEACIAKRKAAQLLLACKMATLL